ncbi:hypothetical protein GCM10010174_69780 [Kutzneria viridogrisea]|uniref:Uncharacterized protein n=1 Tax=Kutzneria viridogrisea TaxID=47990 RepID=A0ABR6BAX3_9PSEU|nr:hypothetical protein [Kutzneria viridogrisea]
MTVTERLGLYGPAVRQPTPAKVRRQPAPCGSYGAYQRHYKRGETPCRPCKKAAATYIALWRARSGKTKHVLVPVQVLGALLAAAPTEVEEWAEQQIGANPVTAAVAVALRDGRTEGDVLDA